MIHRVLRVLVVASALGACDFSSLYDSCVASGRCGDDGGVGGGTGGGVGGSGGDGGTAPAVTEAPLGVTATPGNGRATVNWGAPASNGGAAITGYTVKSTPSGFTATTTGALTAAVTGLLNGTSYTFTVTATNAVGSGPASAASNAVVPAVDYEWVQWTVPPISPPAANYSVDAGVVTDTATQLVWQRVPGGSNTWAGAQTYCASLSLGGLSGWRMPTLIELDSIVDYATSNPAIEPTVFPATPTGFFWSASSSGLDANNAGAVEFGYGFDGFHAKTNAYQVRCVRCVAAPCQVPAGGAGAPAGRYTVSMDTVFDTKTMLTWQRNAPLTAYAWSNAGAYCAGLSLSGTGWRIPTIKELQSLVDTRAPSGPTIDTVAFPTTPPAAWFWSSSVYAGNTGYALVVFFASAETNYGNISFGGQVRCVR